MFFSSPIFMGQLRVRVLGPCQVFLEAPKPLVVEVEGNKKVGPPVPGEIPELNGHHTISINKIYYYIYIHGQVKDMDEMDMIGYARWIQMVDIYWLVVSNMFFSTIYGMPSFPLTHIFQDG